MYLSPETVNMACLNPFFLAQFSTCTEFGTSLRLSLANGIFVEQKDGQNQYYIFKMTFQSIIFNQPIKHSQFTLVHIWNDPAVDNFRGDGTRIFSVWRLSLLTFIHVLYKNSWLRIRGSKLVNYFEISHLIAFCTPHLKYFRFQFFPNV